MKLKITEEQLEKLTNNLKGHIIVTEEDCFLRSQSVARVLEIYENMKLLNKIEKDLAKESETDNDISLLIFD